MKTNNITKLALKLAGLYVLVQATIYLSPLVQSLMMMDQFPEAKMASITLAITIGVLLILGLWLVLKNKPTFEEEASNSSNIMTAVLATGGIILFALALADLPVVIIRLMGNEALLMVNEMENWMSLVGSLIQLALGGFLFFKAKFFAKLVG